MWLLKQATCCSGHEKFCHPGVRRTIASLYRIPRFTQVFLCRWAESTEQVRNSSSPERITVCFYRATVVYLRTIHRASKSFKWHRVHSEVCLADFFPLTQQQPVWMEKGLSHLSCYCLYCFLSPPSVHTVCPQVPPPLPVPADLRISSLDDSSSPWDERYSRFKCTLVFVFVILNKFQRLKRSRSSGFLRTCLRLKTVGEKKSKRRV